MSDEEDPKRRILIGHILELARVSAAAQSRRGAEILAAVLLAVFFGGLIATHISGGNNVGLIMSLAAVGVGGCGQILILDAPSLRWPVLSVSAVLALMSLALLGLK